MHHKAKLAVYSLPYEVGLAGICLYTFGGHHLTLHPQKTTIKVENHGQL